MLLARRTRLARRLPPPVQRALKHVIDRSTRRPPTPTFPQDLVLAALQTLATARLADLNGWKPARLYVPGMWVEDPRQIVWAMRRIAQEGDGDQPMPLGLACALLHAHTGGISPADIAQVIRGLQTNENDEDLAMVLDLVVDGFTPNDAYAAGHADLRVAVARDWARMYGIDTLTGCLRAGLTRTELRTIYETGQMPPADQIATLAALRHGPLGPPA